MKRNHGAWAHEPRKPSNSGHMLGTILILAGVAMAGVTIGWLVLEMAQQIREAATFDKAVTGW